MNAALPATESPTTSRRWRRRGLWTIGLLALVWFGPAIIANSPWRDYAINLALGKVNGRVSTKAASLGWFSPVQVSGLRVDDSQGRPMVDVPEIRTSKSLLGLLWDRSDIGEIRLEKPSLHLVLSDQSSNLEDALAPLLEQPSDAAASPRFRVVVENGAATLEDDSTGKSWEIRDLEADVQSLVLGGGKYTFDAQGVVVAVGSDSATFDIGGEIEPKEGQGLAGEVHVVAEKLPLDALTPLLRRAPDPIRVDGALSGAVTYRWTASNQHALGLQKIAAETLTIASPKHLGSAQVQLSKLEAGGKIALDDQRVVFEGFTLDSTAAKVEATGGANFDILAQLVDPTRLSELLRDEDLTFKAELDVAETARAFPDILRIRRGTEIQAGKFHVDLVSRGEGEQRTWKGGVKADALSALHEGKQVVWENPVDLAFKAHKGREGVILDELTCQSSFLTAEGAGTLKEGRFQVQADLAALYSELSRFCDLGDIQLRGKMRGRAEWSQSHGDEIQTTADAKIENFALQAPGQPAWEEKELTIKSTVNLVLENQAIGRASGGELSLVSGGDRCSLVLLKPVAAPFDQATWPFRVEGNGKLETWCARLSKFLPLTGWELAGQFNVAGEAELSPTTLRWSNARGAAQQVRAFGHSYYIQEPRIELLGSKGSFDLASGALQIDELSARGASLSILAEKVVVQPTAENFHLAGRIDYEAKLETLQSWRHHPQLPPEMILQGRAKGMIIADTDGASASINYTVEAAPFTIAKAVENRSATRAEPASTRAAQRNVNVLWRESSLLSSGRVEYDLQSGQTRLDGVRVSGDSLAATIKGVLRDLSTQCVADVSGELEYDADKLSPLLAAATGFDMQISGRRKEKFTLRGPITPIFTSLERDFAIPAVMRPVPGAPARGPVVSNSSWPLDLKMDTGLSWSKANISGFTLGPVEIDARLKDGLVRIDPLEISLATGKLRLEPVIDLATRPYLVRFASGQIVKDAEITPQLCRSWLKYVNPLLADVTEVEGRFSLELADSAFPLAQPMLGEATGKLILHGGQVGPGPLSQTLIELGKQVEAILKSRPPGNIRPWLTMPSQEVRFAVQGGNVFHEQITFELRDVTIVTRGRVGLDQSIQLQAEIPIKDAWIEKERILAGLKGQSLVIPIGGTLTDPKVDARAITDIGARAVGGAIRNKLDDELQKGLQKGLEKLLPSKK